jgi:glycosyltransferase involved in cell wall biosynthesis
VRDAIRAESVLSPKPVVAVVLPCFRVADKICDVLLRIGPEVDMVFVVDDACPESSGTVVETRVRDPRVRVLRHQANEGVGGAVLTGYAAAISAGADIIVKIDGDGQMDPALVPLFIAQLESGSADYAKGNRFYDLTHVRRMPFPRLVGNAVLSFMSKLSTGYWNLFDPTNGYTAISSRVAERLPHRRISKRYFFETDVLFQLNALRCVVVDVPMDAVYEDERSNLRIRKVIGEFAFKHARNLASRIFYCYFLRDFTIASLFLIAGIGLLTFGVVFGGTVWYGSYRSGTAAPLGTIMVAALPALVGFQLLLAFVTYDVASVPSRAVARRLPRLLIRPASGSKRHAPSTGNSS